jgi:hypothetical protein
VPDRRDDVAISATWSQHCCRSDEKTAKKERRGKPDRPEAVAVQRKQIGAPAGNREHTAYPENDDAKRQQKHGVAAVT